MQQEGKIGVLVPGARADLIAVPIDGPVIDPYETAVFNEQPVTFAMIGGKVVIV